MLRKVKKFRVFSMVDCYNKLKWNTNILQMTILTIVIFLFYNVIYM